MDFLIEIILLIFTAPLMEILLTAVGSFIANRHEKHHAKKEFDHPVESSTDTVFTMTQNRETRGAMLFLLVCVISAFMINIVAYTAIYVSKGMSLKTYIILEVVSQTILFPILLGVLHCATKKFRFTDYEIIIKSAIYIKRVQFEQITSVTETNYSRLYLALKVTYNKVRKDKYKTKMFKIAQNFGNYERAKKRLWDIRSDLASEGSPV